MTVQESAISELTINAVYAIELCGGEVRYWQYLGPDSRRFVWWRSTETKQEFNEVSLRTHGRSRVCMQVKILWHRKGDRGYEH